MKCLATALGTLLLALAVTPSANAVVRPEWVVVRWAYGDCKIWHNDVNGPAGAGWKAVAFAGKPGRSFRVCTAPRCASNACSRHTKATALPTKPDDQGLAAKAPSRG
jgi:hypothetical protein